MDKPTLGLSTALTSGSYGLQNDKPSSPLPSLLQSLSLHGATFQQQLQRFTHKQLVPTSTKPLLTNLSKATKLATGSVITKAPSPVTLRQTPAVSRDEAAPELQASSTPVGQEGERPHIGEPTQNDGLNASSDALPTNNIDTPTETVVEEAATRSADATSQATEENQTSDSGVLQNTIENNDQATLTRDDGEGTVPTVSPELLAALLTQLPQLLQIVAPTPSLQLTQGLGDAEDGQALITFTPSLSEGTNLSSNSVLYGVITGPQAREKMTSLAMMPHAKMLSSDCLTVVGQVGVDVLAVPATTEPQAGEAGPIETQTLPTQTGVDLVPRSTPAQAAPTLGQDHQAGLQALLSVVAQLSPQELATVTIEDAEEELKAVYQLPVMLTTPEPLTSDDGHAETKEALPLAQVLTVEAASIKPTVQPSKKSPRNPETHKGVIEEFSVGNSSPRVAELPARLPSQAQSNTSDQAAFQSPNPGDVLGVTENTERENFQDTLPAEALTTPDSGALTGGSVSVASHPTPEVGSKSAESAAPASGPTPTPLPNALPVPAESRRLTLHLAPQTLGQVEVVLTKAANGEVSAKVMVHSAEAHTRLRQELASLTQKLHQQGINPQQVELTLAPALQQEQTQKLRLMGPTAQEWTQQLQVFDAARSSADTVQATGESFQAKDQGDLGRDGRSQDFSQNRDDGLSSQAGLGGQFSQQFQQRQDAALFEALQPRFGPDSRTEAATQGTLAPQEQASLMASDLAANQLLTGLDLPSTLATAYTAYTIFEETPSQVLFPGDDNPLEMDARLLVGT